MSQKTFSTHAVADIRWKGEQEIGRKMPPSGTEKFAATARFAEDDKLKLFSVVLLYPPSLPSQEETHQEAKLHFFAPELVLPRLKVGSVLHITDGIKIIAEARINNVENLKDPLSKDC